MTAQFWSLLLFSLSLASMCVILILSLVATLREDFQFWPPPERKSWQHRSFLILFRCFLYPLVVLSVLEFEIGSLAARYIALGIGAFLLLAGFGLAVRITLQMGWRNAFGEKRGLVTDGYFSISRNPVYVATWLGLIGWALVANSVLVSILLGFWAALYLFAPLFEEPWLEQMYGDEFREYRLRVRRFF
ncbi:MAG: isoprenylcysteine carboxylmethyltransferase family protein [Sphingomonadales bacterium]|nr:isoprenylcysteine carboxylmethyltransferase family protein [Sphingomonadales bacterium]